MKAGSHHDFLGIRRTLWLGVVMAGGILLLLGLLRSLLPLTRHPADARPSQKGAQSLTPSQIHASGTPFVRLRRGAHPVQTRWERPISQADLAPPDPSEVGSLITQLTSPWPEERVAAAGALGRLMFAAAEAIPTLRTLSRHDPDDAVRHAAAEALLNIRGYVSPPTMF